MSFNIGASFAVHRRAGRIDAQRISPKHMKGFAGIAKVITIIEASERGHQSVQSKKVAEKHRGAAQKMSRHEVIDRFLHGCYKGARWFRLQRPCKGLSIGQGNNGVSLRTQDSTAWTMASSGPSGLEGVFYYPFGQAVTVVQMNRIKG